MKDLCMFVDYEMNEKGDFHFQSLPLSPTHPSPPPPPPQSAPPTQSQPAFELSFYKKVWNKIMN